MLLNEVARPALAEATAQLVEVSLLQQVTVCSAQVATLSFEVGLPRARTVVAAYRYPAPILGEAREV